jgi:hypothetical protein
MGPSVCGCGRAVELISWSLPHPRSSAAPRAVPTKPRCGGSGVKAVLAYRCRNKLERHSIRPATWLGVSPRSRGDAPYSCGAAPDFDRLSRLRISLGQYSAGPRSQQTDRIGAAAFANYFGALEGEFAVGLTSAIGRARIIAPGRFAIEMVGNSAVRAAGVVTPIA